MATAIVTEVEKIWLSTNEVIKYLGIGKDYLDRLREEGKIPYYKPTGKKPIFYKKSEIDRFIAKGKVI